MDIILKKDESKSENISEFKSDLLQQLKEEAFNMNQKTDHVKLLTDLDDNGPTKYQFLLRQGWTALIYRDLRLRDKLKFTELANMTGYSSQMWRNLMKANYDVVEVSQNKLNIVSDKFIQTVTNSLLAHGYFIDTKKMVNFQKKSGAMVRMFWAKGKCSDVLIQNSSEGPDIEQNERLALNLKDAHIKRLSDSLDEWDEWSDLDLKRWVTWSNYKNLSPEIESKFLDLSNDDFDINVITNKVSISVNENAVLPINLMLKIERDDEGNIIVTSSYI